MLPLLHPPRREAPEPEARAQLAALLHLPGARAAAGFPDLHPGAHGPVGCALLTEAWVHPAVVGGDVGCGIGLWRLPLPARRRRDLDALVEQLQGIDAPWEGDGRAWLAAHGAGGAPDGVGTIGGGNHFLEIQEVEEILLPDAALGLAAGDAVLAVHTGSRGHGRRLLAEHALRHGAAGLPEDHPDAQAWITGHDAAVAWARANRALCAARAADALGLTLETLLDVPHNLVERRPDGWLHRKGAAAADRGPVLLPGSRGDASWIVQPLPCAEGGLLSLAHGAGRRLSRAQARARLADVPAAHLARARGGARVVCGDPALLREEAPEAYRPIADVVGGLEDAGLARPAVRLRPLLTFKSSTADPRRGQREDAHRRRDLERRDARRAKERGRWA